ncbi:uncharacterized protein LOC131156361 [Malania oleifera]|uniref:uncharacterized protein LOC131156361 n=1 Tax=Malania oleifera TaxID=397392 RepID=UPI0025AE8AB2|nr:uncharacterized protein LOC131156361 [Malania oleifera]XP_057965970.1 uncharacterized protein LOC131156361 [Malania oleifera]
MAFEHETTATTLLYSSSVLMQEDDDDQEYCSSSDPPIANHCRHRDHHQHHHQQQQLLAGLYEYDNDHRHLPDHPHMSRLSICSNSSTTNNPMYSNGDLICQDDQDEEDDDDNKTVGMCMSMLSIESFDADDEECSDEKEGDININEGLVLWDSDDELQVGFCSLPATPPRRRPITRGREGSGGGGGYVINSQQVKKEYGSENEGDHQKLGVLLGQQDATARKRRRRRRRITSEGWGVGGAHFIINNSGATSTFTTASYKEKNVHGRLDEKEKEEEDEDDDKMEIGSGGRNMISNGCMMSNKEEDNKGSSCFTTTTTTTTTGTGEESTEGGGGLVVITRPKGGRRCLCMDLEEVKACKDLGFELEHEPIARFPTDQYPSPTSVSASASPIHQQQHLEYYPNTSSGANSPILSWRMISSPGDDPRDVKARLKVWAQAVALASTSRQTT